MKSSPTASIYTPWTEPEVLSHLATGWGTGAIIELRLEYLNGTEPKFTRDSFVKFCNYHHFQANNDGTKECDRL